MKATKLFLTEKQVPVGTTVAIYLDGKNEPESDKYGQMIFKVLYGGIPMRKNFYPVDLIKVTPWEEIIESNGEKKMVGNSIIATSMSGFKPNIRFVPLQMFTLNDAPVCSEFAIFVEGKLLFYPAPYSDDEVSIRTNEEGRLLSNNGYAYDYYMKEYTLPKNAILVPTREIGSLASTVKEPI